MGTWTVIGHDQARLFSVRGRGTCVLKFALPGGQRLSRKVEIGDQPPTVMLDRR